MSNREQLKQPWKSISTDYLDEQAKALRESTTAAQPQVPEGQTILKGGTGGAPIDATSWKLVLYDTKEEEADAKRSTNVKQT